MTQALPPPDTRADFGLPTPSRLEPEAWSPDAPQNALAILARAVTDRIALVVAHCEHNAPDASAWVTRLRGVVADIDGDRDADFDELVLDAVLSASRTVSPHNAGGANERAAAFALLQRLQENAFARAELQLQRLLDARLTRPVLIPRRLQKNLRPGVPAPQRGTRVVDALVVITMIRASVAPSRTRRPDVDDLVRQVLSDPGVRLSRAAAAGARAISRKRSRTRQRNA